MSENKYTLEKKASVKNGISRMIFAVLSVMINSLIIVYGIMRMRQNWPIFSFIFTTVGIFIVLVIYGKHTVTDMKLTWMLVISLFPVAGIVFYLMVGLNRSTNKMRHRYKKIDEVLLPLLPDNQDVVKKIREENPQIANIMVYLKNYAGYPVYENTDITYYDDPVKGLEAQKIAMNDAKKFIFIEYHAIQDAEIWQEIQTILEKKVSEGVEVRVFYDDMGSIGFVNTDFVKRLKLKGIKARVFNPFAPGLNLFLNNRDHRKITVIDGEVGFTGGYNLANEYFHIDEPYGFWKDSGIRIQGEAVKSLTVTFLEMWNSVKGNDIDDTSFEQYLIDHAHIAKEKAFVAPYADNPMDEEQVGLEVYMSIAEAANDYVWFVSPYLIITDEMSHTLSLAAKRGVDVRIITPGIPDKKSIYSVTRSYYNSLVRNGVRIFEYTPGFCHCKMCVSDDKLATCGTINLDYRSLYHHFENGCIYSGCEAVMDTKKDFEKMFSESLEVTDYYKSGRRAFLRFGQMILRLFAPLL